MVNGRNQSVNQVTESLLRGGFMLIVCESALYDPAKGRGQRRMDEGIIVSFTSFLLDA